MVGGVLMYKILDLGFKVLSLTLSNLPFYLFGKIVDLLFDEGGLHLAYFLWLCA